MNHYSLIEYKLRRYFYLGHEYSIYIPPFIRKGFWELEPWHLDDVTGVRLIAKIVEKNKMEEIDSIVPIILKVKKEGKLIDEKNLIFILAVCTKFNFGHHCIKMVSDAYKAVLSVCTDGLKLLMFVKFCHDINIILYDKGYISIKPTGFGAGFRKAMKKWYLSRDPLLTTEQILKDKHYCGWTHKDVMKLCSLQSNNPSQKIFIIHTMFGMKRVEKLFGSQVNDIQIKNNYETFERFQLKFIYNYLKQVNSLKNMNETQLLNEIELRRWGHEFKVLPQKWLINPKVLATLVIHMPLRDVLDRTFFFAQSKLFTNKISHMGMWEFISRFNNEIQLKKNYIHPIESYLEYVKYSRTSINILRKQNDILRKKYNFKCTLDEHKFKLLIEMPYKKNQHSIEFGSSKKKCVLEKFKSKLTKRKLTYYGKNRSGHNQTLNQIQYLDESAIIKTEGNYKELAVTTNQLLYLNINRQQNNYESILETRDQVQSDFNTQMNQRESYFMILLQPLPKLADTLLEFLSKDLVNKSLKTLEPTGQRILIAYDNRKYMKKYKCACSDLLKVNEAITLIILSLISPEKLKNKPTIFGINGEKENTKIDIQHKNGVSFAELDAILFKESFLEWDPDYNEKNIPRIDPLPVIQWARINQEIFDVFVFLGTSRMNYKHLKNFVKEYQLCLKKPIKIVVCCLNGKHTEQRNLGRGNMLFIGGFDKNVGKIIHSFINDEF